MIRTDRRLRLCGFLLACCLCFIWGNSLLPAELSQAFSDWVKALLAGIFTGDASPSGGSGLLRKAAHFTEFTALGICLGWLLGMLRKGILWPFGLGVAAACIDETIQLFVPGRGPGIWDVLLDSCGVAAGIALVYFGHTYCKRKSTKPILEE